MPTAADIADWWDKNRRETSKWLDSFIEDHPNMFTVVCVGVSNAALDLGAGFVDALRLGQGVEEGGWGYAKDALRLSVLLGPLGRAGRAAQALAGTRSAKLIANVRGPVCAWVTATRALKHVGAPGAKLFAAVDDLAAAIGESMSSLKGASIRQVAAALRSIGAKVGEVKTVGSMAEVEEMVPRDGSVVIVSLRAFKAGQELDVGHQVYVFRDLLNRVRIMDRTVGGAQDVYLSLEELGRRYSSVADTFVPRAALPVTNVFGKIVEGMQPAAVIAMEVLATPAMRPEIADATLRAYRQGHEGLGFNKQTFHRVLATDTLDGLAKQYYRDSEKWPIIYAGNSLQIGDDPRKLPVGKVLWIPSDK
jgi:nucleoid-associated protein YgaU